MLYGVSGRGGRDSKRAIQARPKEEVGGKVIYPWPQKTADLPTP